MVIWIIFNLFVLIHYGLGQSEIGDPCVIKATGRNGVCRLFSNCVQAMENLQRNIYPEICGFQGHESIVCCGGSGLGVIRSLGTTPKPTTKMTPPITTRPTTRKPTQPTRTFVGFGAKSRQKCVEYQEYVFEEETVLAGVLQVNRVDYCSLVFVDNIVGGTEAKPREFAHMALIGWPKNNSISWECGGTLISDEFVLTAAHCLYHPQLEAQPKYVRIGELQLHTNKDDARVQDFTVMTIFRHPSYVFPLKYNDIGLIRLNKKVRLNSYARPACLNIDANIRVKKAVASGWGKIGYTDEVSKHLRKVTLEFFNGAECNKTYKTIFGKRMTNGIVDESQVCAGHHTKARDTCLGDSGGPLQIIHQDPSIYCMYSVVGVTSFGIACGVARIPGVYTRVSHYIDWIENIVWP